MTKQEIAKMLFVKYVTEANGGKLMELLPKFAIYLETSPTAMMSAEEAFSLNLPELIEQLIQERKLIEIEYVLPQSPSQARSFILPTGMEIRMNVPPGSVKVETTGQVVV